MKKFIFIFMSFILFGCSCLSQMPNQYIFIDETCSAILPDYLSKITVTDNCAIGSITQSPVAGTPLVTLSTMIDITATDNSGNATTIVFEVRLLDTIPPVIIVDSTMLYSGWDIPNTLYDMADRIISDKMTYFDEYFPYSKYGLDKKMEDSTYFKKQMVTWTSPGHAVTGFGGRIMTFVADTINN